MDTISSHEPILATCLHAFPGVLPDGTPVHAAGPDHWYSVMAEVAREGFSHVEIADNWMRFTELDAAQRADFRAVLSETGLQAPSVHVARSSVIEPGREAMNLSYAHAAIDASADLGMSVFSTGLHQPLSKAQRDALWFWTAQGPVDPSGDFETWQLAVRSLRELGEHAASVGLIMSLELYEDTYLGSADAAVRLVEDIDHPAVGLNPDVGNLIRLHQPVEDWREIYAKTLPHANYWHLKNYARDEAADGSWATSTPSTLRDGLIDYREVVALAVQLGYEGVYTLEQYGGDSLSVCAENARHLSNLIDNAHARLTPRAAQHTEGARS